MSNEFSLKLKLLTSSSIITKITKREERSEEVRHVNFFKIFLTMQLCSININDYFTQNLRDSQDDYICASFTKTFATFLNLFIFLKSCVGLFNLAL